MTVDASLPGRHRRRRGRRVGRAVAVVVGGRVGLGLLDRAERRDQPLPDGRAVGRREPVDRREDVGLVAGRRVDRDARVAERDEPDRRRPAAAARRCFDAIVCAVSIRVGGRSVGGHAGRDVEGEHDRALGPRQRHGRLRPGDRDDEHDEPDDDERARQQRAPAPARGGAPCGARRSRRGRPSSAEARARRRSLDPARGEHAERHEDEEQQQLRREEGHARFRRRRLRRVAMRTIARTRSSSVDSVTASMPARPNARASSASRSAAAASNRRRNFASCVSTHQLLAGLGVLDHDRPDVRAARSRAGRRAGPRAPRGGG